MFGDMQRVDQARRYLDEVLRTGTGVSIIAVDRDRPTVVRRRGVGEKHRLVMQFPALIRSHIPETTYATRSTRRMPPSRRCRGAFR